MDKPVVATTCQIWKPVERLEAKKDKACKGYTAAFFHLGCCLRWSTCKPWSLQLCTCAPPFPRVLLSFCVQKAYAGTSPIPWAPQPGSYVQELRICCTSLLSSLWWDPGFWYTKPSVKHWFNFADLFLEYKFHQWCIIQAKWFNHNKRIQTSCNLEPGHCLVFPSSPGLTSLLEPPKSRSNLILAPQCLGGIIPYCFPFHLTLLILFHILLK